MIDHARHLRQILVAEIGEAGQARLVASELALGGAGLAHEIAARYARGAGARVVTGAIDVAALAPDEVTAPAAREVLAGARAAVAAIARAVRVAP